MGKVETDEEGNVINNFGDEKKYAGWAVTGVRYLCMILLYGGIICIIVGLFTMTPENANGRGSVPLVSDAVRATPVGNPPPGANDAAGAAGDAAAHVPTGFF